MKRKKPFYLVRVTALIGVCLPFTETYKTVRLAERFIAEQRKHWHNEASMRYTILRCVPVRKGSRQ